MQHPPLLPRHSKSNLPLWLATVIPCLSKAPKVTRAALHIPATLIEEPNALTMQVGKSFANEAVKSNTAESRSKHIDSIKPTPKPLHNTQPSNTPQLAIVKP